ncbi:MAG TPA: hypothetical protein VII08_00480 [Myxococcales bacterium]
MSARTRTVTWEDPSLVAKAGLAMAGADFLRAILERRVHRRPSPG